MNGENGSTRSQQLSSGHQFQEGKSEGWNKRTPTEPKGKIVKKFLLFLLLVGAALAGIALWAYYPRSYTLAEHQLQFSHVQRGTMREAVSATGRLEPREVIAVTSEIPGKIIAMFARPNDRVKEGALLARLDDRKAQLDVEEAQSGVEAGKAALAQALAMKKGADLALEYQTEIEKQGGFRSERDKAQVQVEVAQAGIQVAQQRLQAATIALKKAQEFLDKTKIKAVGSIPTSSTLSQRGYLVMDRQIQVGQLVGPQGSPMFLLSPGLEAMEVHTQVAEGDVPRVRKGQEASFTVTAFTEDDIEFRGIVKEIRPMALSAQGAVYYDTVIEVANQKDSVSGEWRLRSGMTASVDIIRREHKNVWKVPTVALNFEMDEEYLGEAARQHIAQWKQRPDAKHWQTLWTWDSPQGKPWPVFVRLGGLNDKGEPGLKDSEFNEILEWEPGAEPRPEETPRIIIHAPPARSPGLFDQPVNIKVS
jgi:HlyD family secretion protein